MYVTRVRPPGFGQLVGWRQLSIRLTVTRARVVHFPSHLCQFRNNLYNLASLNSNFQSFP